MNILNIKKLIFNLKNQIIGLFLFIIFVFFYLYNPAKVKASIVTDSLIYNPYHDIYYEYGLGEEYIMGVKIAALVGEEIVYVKGTGLIDPDRGTGFDISSYLTNDTKKDLLFNAGYQNALTIPEGINESVLAEKGLEIDGDVLTGKIMFQGKELMWSKPIRGQYILYYED